jgi:NTP pyrophosphatase (non-canonical NTP hydrolase)
MLNVIHETILEQIRHEANYAHDKHGFHSMLYGTDDKALRILTEEVGEVAREMNEIALGNRTHDQYTKQLRAELIQVAAIAVTWIEKLDTGIEYANAPAT